MTDDLDPDGAGPDRLKPLIREAAEALGFARIGFARAEGLEREGAHLQAWLEAGMHGEMGYLARDPAKRADPTVLFPGARTVVVVALDYWTPGEVATEPLAARFSRYAQGEDYHEVLGRKLDALVARIRELAPGAAARGWVDTGPVLEKAWAVRAGVGWVGKNGNVILPRRGSWVFLGAVLLDLALPADPPAVDRCGTCTRCIPACPTDAIVAPGVVDARRCISYLTIELKGPIPREFRRALGNRVYGCDDCQEVCPWNRFVPPTAELAFGRRLGAPALRELLALDQAAFSARFKGSPVKRTRRRGLLRNAAIALGNAGDLSAVPDLVGALSDAEPLVRGAAAWALGELGGDEARAALAARSDQEDDPQVADEIAQALAGLS